MTKLETPAEGARPGLPKEVSAPNKLETIKNVLIRQAQTAMELANNQSFDAATRQAAGLRFELLGYVIALFP